MADVATISRAMIFSSTRKSHMELLRRLPLNGHSTPHHFRSNCLGG